MFKLLLRIVLMPVAIALRFLPAPLMKYFLKPPVFKFRDDKNPDALKILFVGNSLTFTNDLPMLLLSFLKVSAETPMTGISVTKGFKVYMVVQGGFTLEDHWFHKVASKYIKKHGPWDYVVLQEQSYSTANKDYDISSHAQLFADQISKIGAKLVWFSTWSYRDDPDLNVMVSTRLAELAGQLQAIEVPVVACWTRLREKHPEIELYADQIHPSPEGTYLAACAFYVVLTGLSPLGLPLEVTYENGDALMSLSEEQAIAMQELTREMLSK